MSATIIDVQNVSKQFGDYTAVDHLSLQVKQGEIYGFLGPNGSGKSTTLRMILGLLQPSSGEIFIFGKSIQRERASIMQQIGCIVEKPDFYTYLSAIDNLKIFARMHGKPTTTAYINQQLEAVGLADRGKDKISAYSHGMKQRLGLAQALLHDPSIIILDEPNTGLDPKGIIELRATLLQLNKERGKTILISSHILPEIEEIADSMILIHNGKTIAQGSIKDLLNKEQLEVKLEVNDTEKAKQILIENTYEFEQLQHNEFLVKTNQANMAMLNQLLVTNNVQVYNLQKMRSLENYFLKLTNPK